MDMETHLLNDIDTNTCENLLHLDQKLKAFRAEIEVKLHAAQEEQLTQLMDDIQQAISAITPVVDLVTNNSL